MTVIQNELYIKYVVIVYTIYARQHGLVVVVVVVVVV